MRELNQMVLQLNEREAAHTASMKVVKQDIERLEGLMGKNESAAGEAM